jgi:tellurite resistance protein
MGLFGKLTRSGGKAISNDAFQAAIAAGVYIGASDGKLDRDESEKLATVIAVNDQFKSFSKSEIQKQIQQYATLINADARMGKLKLKKEIEDVASNTDVCEQVFITALSVAEASGDIGPAEYKALCDIGSVTGHNPADFDVQAPANVSAA